MASSRSPSICEAPPEDDDDLTAEEQEDLEEKLIDRPPLPKLSRNSKPRFSFLAAWTIRPVRGGLRDGPQVG